MHGSENGIQSKNANSRINAWVGEWYPIEERELSYNSRGLVINEIDINNEEGTYSKISTEYNDEGLMISKMETYSENGTDYLNNSKTIREYDSRVSDFITLNNEWLWIDEDWLLAGNNYTHTITRDEATGNIAKVERAVYFNGIFDPTMRLTIEYTDGKASKITQTDLTYDYDTGEYAWMTSMVYSDIVWERTDGQIVSLDNVTSGNNRISSCHVQGFEYGDDYTATSVYNENGNISFTLLGTIDGYENTRVEGSTELLANGGTKVIETYITEIEGEPYKESYTDIMEYDDYGFSTLVKSTTTFNDEYTMVDYWSVGTLTYDETYGYPLTYQSSTYEMDEDTEDFYEVPEMLVEFSDYIDATSASVPTIAVEEDAAPIYYNLQGIRIDAEYLSTGIYIVRQGSKVSKVAIH